MVDRPDYMCQDWLPHKADNTIGLIFSPAYFENRQMQ